MSDIFFSFSFERKKKKKRNTHSQKEKKKKERRYKEKLLLFTEERQDWRNIYVSLFLSLSYIDVEKDIFFSPFHFIIIKLEGDQFVWTVFS